MSEMQQTRIPNPQGSGAWKTGWKGLGDGLSRQLWLLQSDALAAEARRRTGLEDFGEPPIEPVLSILANSLELQADLHPLGRFLMSMHVRGLLETRLRLAQAWSGELEGLDSSPIQRPVFITGMPRSGSTFLHELMAEDPENRAQLRHPTKRWVLKSPDHVHGLEDLMAVFPDAVIVQTHRNPIDTLRSAIQLAEVLEGLFIRVGARGQIGIRV
jgi:hypothetical protein